MTIPLEGKVVLITGASSGFGEDAARLFAREGCKVVLAARRLERLQALAEKIRSEGGEALAIPVDIANRPEIENMVRAALDVFGQIDILFNNAGFGRLNWLENLDPGRDIETQIRVNLLGMIETTRLVLPHMLARRQGHIINMISVAGLIPAPMYSIYGATKFGTRAFTDALRREVAPFGLHVSGIYPGPAVTEFGQHTGTSSGKSSAVRLLSRFSFLSMSSEYVAERVVGLARRPRRRLVVPWWFSLIVALDTLFPAFVDWALRVLFTGRFHHLPDKRTDQDSPR